MASEIGFLEGPQTATVGNGKAGTLSRLFLKKKHSFPNCIYHIKKYEMAPDGSPHPSVPILAN